MTRLTPPPGTEGLLNLYSLPDEDWNERWDRIIVDTSLKERILNYSIFTLTQRASYSTIGLPLHSLLLLVGPPGTGKTTLAQGLANKVAQILSEDGQDTLFVEVDPHAFPSEMLGESQRRVSRLLGKTIPSIAKRGGYLIVLLDEVEALAVARSRASFETNPVDVHRATDAVLTGLDLVADGQASILFVATSNFEKGIDEAFLSRVDLVEQVGLPDANTIREILIDTMRTLRNDDLTAVDADADKLDELVQLAEGLDARQLRKLILGGLLTRRELVLHPETLDWQDLIDVLREREKVA